MITQLAEARPSSRPELALWYEAVLDEQERSGLSVAEVADEIGVTPSTLYNWRRRLQTSAEDSSVVAPGLVRVEVRPNERAASVPAALVVRVGRDRAIEVTPGFDAKDLLRLVEVLESC